jgi:ribosomal protein S18 acetylase RimI-like enzyme
MTYEIRAATLFDLTSLQKLEQICFLEDAWPIFDLVAVLTFANVVRLKAIRENQMVGFIAGDPRPSEGLSWIATLGVLPEYRNLGIGKALLSTCEQQLQSSRMRLCVRPTNLAALELYRQSGYETIDQWKKYYNDGGDALVMEKIL